MTAFLTGPALTGRRNGFALCGAYVSAASLLGVSGTIALYGYDGTLYCVGGLAAWIPLLLLARHLHHTGRLTMADVLCHRAVRRPPVRIASAVSTVTISLCLLVAQLWMASHLVSYLFGAHLGPVVGVLTVGYAVVGGTRAVTWAQIVKTVVLLTCCSLVALLVVARFGFDPGALLGAAADASGSGPAYLDPGLRFGGQTPPPPAESLAGRLDFVSLAVALALGATGLPHVVNRLFSSGGAVAARTSVSWALGLTGGLLALLPVLGLGAAGLIGHEELLARDPSGLMAAPELAREVGVRAAGAVGGDIVLAVFTAGVLAAVVAVGGSVLIAASTSVAHDLFGQVLMFGRPKADEQAAVARVSTAVIGATAVALAWWASDVNPGFLAGLALTVAASANFPVLVLGLFWRRLTGAGVVAGIYGGLVTSVVLEFFSPAVSGRVDAATGKSLSLLPAGMTFDWFPLENPALVSVPVGFLCALAAGLLSREKAEQNSFRELTVLSLTGVH